MSGFSEVVRVIFNYLESIVDGIVTFVESLLFILGIGNSATIYSWLPSSVVTVMSLSVVSIIVLRVVGR